MLGCWVVMGPAGFREGFMKSNWPTLMASGLSDVYLGCPLVGLSMVNLNAKKCPWNSIPSVILELAIWKFTGGFTCVGGLWL